MSTLMRGGRLHRDWAAVARRLAVVAMLGIPVQIGLGAPAATDSTLPQRLVVAVLENGYPLEDVRDGKLTGFSGELFNELLAGSGTAVELRRYARRDETMRAACRGEVDLVLGAVPLPEYADCLVYSSGYLERSAVIVARKGDERALEPGFLHSATVIVVAGAPWGQELLKTYPGVRLIEMDTVAQSMRALADGKADVYIGTTVRLNRALDERQYDNLTSLRRLDLGSTVFRFAAPVRSAETIRELDRRLALTPDSMVENLRDRWLRGKHQRSEGDFELSTVELQLIDAHRVIRYTVPLLQLPFAMEDSQGNLNGLTVDYLAYLQRVLGVEFIYVPSRGPEDAQALLARGDVDLIAGTFGKQAVASNLISAGTYASVPMVIVTRANAPYTSSLEAIRGRRVAMVASSPMSGAVRDNLPATHLVAVKDARQGFELLRSQEVDAMIGNLATMDALVRGDAGRDLRIAGAAGFNQNFDLWLSARLAPLHAVIDRALTSIPAPERSRMERRWTAIDYQFDTSWAALLARYWPALALAGLVILMLAVSHLRLRHQISRRRQTEMRLADELVLKEALLACLPQPIAAKDADRRYTAMNAAFEKFFGVDKANYLGQQARVITTPSASIDALLRLQDGALAAMEARHTTLPLVNAEGEERTVIAWAVPYLNRDGSSSGVLTMYLDITEIHEARQRAMRVEQQLKDVTESLPAVVFQIRRGKNERKWQISYVAGNVPRVLGVDVHFLLAAEGDGRRVLQSSEFRRLMHAFDQADESPQPVELQLRVVEELGGGWVQVSAVPKREGEYQIWNGVVSDITDQHRQAVALREAKDIAEAALRAKEGFLAMMSHEIRTPMNGVLGLVEVLQRSHLSGEQQRLLALAKESGQALAQILDDILDYAKIEAGRLSITPEPLDLRELLDGVLSLLLPQAHGKGLQVRNSVDACVPAMVHADGIRVRQILFNLFGNSIKFTDRGGVKLHTSVESMEGDAAVVLVTVEDTGIGIPRADIQRLFAPFVQSERSSARRFGGTGLGLSISRRLAEMMGGQLTLESEEGVGTIASLRIPCSVLRVRYDLPLLKGCPVVLDVPDAEIRASLGSLASAAGMRLIPEGEADPSGEAIYFVDTDHPKHAARERYVVQVSSVPKQLGYRVESGIPRLSINPLRWTAFLAATEVLYGGQAMLDGASTEEVAHPEVTPAPFHKVLVVEDHPINRELVQQQLQLLGCSSHVVENGKEALVALARETFDLVLTDCHMPVMNGFELTSAIRASEDMALRNIPVVGVTATTVREELLRCLEVGMNSYVLKPTTLASLRQALVDAGEGYYSADEIASGAVDPAQPVTAGGIDWNEVADALAGMLDNPATRRMLIDSLREDRDRLRHNLAKGSIEELRAWCHRSSGAISMFGQEPLDTVFALLREALHGGEWSLIERRCCAIFEVYERLLSIFERADAVAESHGR